MKAIKIKMLLLALFMTFVGFVGDAAAVDSFMGTMAKQELIQAGKKAYEVRCSGCHGLDGKGQGPGAKMLEVKPRDFTKGTFKFKTRPIGAVPTDEDLIRTLNQGIPNSSMPSFKLVGDTEKLAIVEYLKTFAPDVWNAKDQPEVVPHLQRPKGAFTSKEEFLKYATRGRIWFQGLGCNTCHGNEGDGNGPSAATLQDTWGNAIKPANFHLATIKRGGSIDDVAYSIMMGVDGTPMPEYGLALQSVEDKFSEIKQKSYIWDLAAYVFYLRGVGAGIYHDEIPVIPAEGIPDSEVQAQIGKYLQ